MRHLMLLGPLAALLLAGCGQPVPDSAATVAPQGVGFGDYATYELDRARREAAPTGAPPGAYAAPATSAFTAPAAVAAAPLGASPALAPLGAATPPSGITTTDLAAAGIGGATLVPGDALPSSPLSAPAPGAVPAAVAGDPGAAFPAVVPVAAPDPATALAAAPTDGGTSAIFGEGVRLGATQIAPGSLSATSEARPEWNPAADPLRDHGLEAQPGNAAPVLVDAPVTAAVADAGPNIVEYALAAPNARGQEYYSRFAFSGAGRASRNCADYRSPDEAQIDFLARGGPDRDSRGLDPDGDGFACGWDPAPFRAALGR